MLKAMVTGGLGSIESPNWKYLLLVPEVCIALERGS